MASILMPRVMLRRDYGGETTDRTPIADALCSAPARVRGLIRSGSIEPLMLAVLEQYSAARTNNKGSVQWLQRTPSIRSTVHLCMVVEHT